MLTRRQFLSTSITGAAVALLPGRLVADAHGGAKSALVDSNLVYISPIKSNGALSSCQAEVWYSMLGPDLYVCTATSSWRAQAPRKGLSKTKLWVGDLGPWRSADYQSLPEIEAMASVETDQDTLELVLAQFSDKYGAAFKSWDSRWRNGLKDGSRTMLKYVLA